MIIVNPDSEAKRPRARRKALPATLRALLASAAVRLVLGITDMG
jgi:hypothetical protein